MPLKVTTRRCSARTFPNSVLVDLGTAVLSPMGSSTCLRTKRKVKRGRLKSSPASLRARQRRPCQSPSMHLPTRNRLLILRLHRWLPCTPTSSTKGMATRLLRAIGIHLPLLNRTRGPCPNSSRTKLTRRGTLLPKWISRATRSFHPKNNSMS